MPLETLIRIKCPHCDARPKRRIELALHIRKVHGLDLIDAVRQAKMEYENAQIFSDIIARFPQLKYENVIEIYNMLLNREEYIDDGSSTIHL